jgi:hypothetical protein
MRQSCAISIEIAWYPYRLPDGSWPVGVRVLAVGESREELRAAAGYPHFRGGWTSGANLVGVALLGPGEMPAARGSVAWIEWGRGGDDEWST